MCVAPVADKESRPSNRMDIKQFVGLIAQNYPYKNEPLTHMKVQKLAFYCYGAIQAFGLERKVSPSDFIFEAWKHGPVNRELWTQFRHCGGQTIAEFPEAATVSTDVKAVLKNAITVYGALSAWSLRQQSHTERPWIEAFERGQEQMPPSEVKAHFHEKFMTGSVPAPEYLFGLGSFRIDGIPIQTYPDFNSLAVAVQRVVKGTK